MGNRCGIPSVAAATAAATAFPFGPIGLGLFDMDPSRILSFLHHQTLLAEEALRYRGIMLSQTSSTKDVLRYNPFFDLLSKDQEVPPIHRRAHLMKNSFRYGMSSDEPDPVTKSSSTITGPIEKALPTTTITSSGRKNSTITIDDQCPDPDDSDAVQIIDDQCEQSNRSDSKGSAEMVPKRGGSYLKDGLRYNPMNYLTTESRDKQSSSSSTSSTSPPPPPPLLPIANMSPSERPVKQMLKPIPESLLLQETIEEETKCVVCNAQFPSVWLLEQHAALQHANLGPMDEKPFICEQCGQSYRYRSAYVKHREQNHRARLPADKLFTCDVCGMQFRYLKSFKKHRLNHALERLHCKYGQRTVAGESGTELVSSSNETLSVAQEIAELQFQIKSEVDDEEDDLIDSPTPELNEQLNQIGHNNSAAHENASTSSVNSTEAVPKISSTENDVVIPTTTSRLHLETNKVFSDARDFLLKFPFGGFQQPRFQIPNHNQQDVEASLMPSTSSIASLLTADRIPTDQALGLNPQEASLLNFLRVDAAEKQRDRRFACPFCGKCVRSKENLKLHVRKHTGERPFVCLFCGRAFGGKSDLTRHLRIHTGERPYHCEACGKCFARADYLSKHLTTHVHNAPR